ncbi:Hypothetical_protein [Hexamita inflata]|uniref:Hypothetical_protein n=1 Tax=Hexamita inflata TaxID=28002 RepID=A0ABP1H4V0_9EUKA
MDAKLYVQKPIFCNVTLTKTGKVRCFSPEARKQLQEQYTFNQFDAIRKSELITLKHVDPHVMKEVLLTNKVGDSSKYGPVQTYSPKKASSPTLRPITHKQYINGNLKYDESLKVQDKLYQIAKFKQMVVEGGFK